MSRGRCFKLCSELIGELVEVDFLEKLLDSLGAHSRTEMEILARVFHNSLVIFSFIENLLFNVAGVLSGVDYDIACEIQHLFKNLRRKVEDLTDS